MKAARRRESRQFPNHGSPGSQSHSLLISPTASPSNPSRYSRMHSIATSTPSRYTGQYWSTPPRVSSRRGLSWNDIHQGFGSEFEIDNIANDLPFSCKSGLKKHTQQYPIKWFHLAPAILTIFFSFMPSQGIEAEIRRQTREVRTLKDDLYSMINKVEVVSADIDSYRKKTSNINRENEKRLAELRNNKLSTKLNNMDTEQYLEIEKIEEIILQRIGNLEKEIKKISAEEVISRYGYGPHFVQLNCLEVRGKKATIVLQLAGIDEMPHAIYHFLQMVEAELWNGLSLINGGSSPLSRTIARASTDPQIDGATDKNNRLVATPMAFDTYHGHHSWEGQRFAHANLTTLSFTEHSQSYPSRSQYSVAFTGHPGGPGFFIRLEDEDALIRTSDVHHQPATFARVVAGIDVLAKFSSNKSGASQMLLIENMELLTSFAIDGQTAF